MAEKFSKQAEIDFMHNFRHDTEGDRWAKHEIETLRAKVLRYEGWIREQGEISDTCTFYILGEVCEDCACHRNKVANTGKTQFRGPYVAKEQGK